MAELTINTDDIAAALRKNLEGFTPDLAAAQVGRVLEVGDGIARVSGLPDAAVNEMLEFEDGTIGLALNLDEDSIGAVVLGDVDSIAEGQAVRATGEILAVPCGDGLLGRVVNTLGEPVDGKGPLTNVGTRRMEVQAPGLTGRKPVHEPLQTGIKAIDSMTPIGRGQRELIIGDRKTGKTRRRSTRSSTRRVGRSASMSPSARRPDGGRRWRPCSSTAPWSTRSWSSPRRRPPYKYLAPTPAAPWASTDENASTPCRLRRPLQAGRGLPLGVAAAAPPAGS